MGACSPARVPAALLRDSAGDFVAPNGGQLNKTSVAQLVAGAPSAANSSQDWGQLYASPPGSYPVFYWGLMTVPRDLAADGIRGKFIKDTGAGRPTSGWSLLAAGAAPAAGPGCLRLAAAAWRHAGRHRVHGRK